jgi:hypothetical protein
MGNYWSYSTGYLDSREIAEYDRAIKEKKEMEEAFNAALFIQRMEERTGTMHTRPMDNRMVMK